MIRRDERSRLAARPKAAGATYTHPFRAPSLTYRELAVPPGAFAASRSPRSRRARPKEQVREELRVAVWEDEGGTVALGRKPFAA
jgi:hypothetical protein